MGDEDSSNFKWIIVGVSFTILGLTYTVVHSFSIFFVALLKEFGWSRSITAGAISLFWVLHGIIGPFAGIMVDRFGSRRVFLLGALLWGTGLVLSSFTHSWWQFYIFFGVITAMGAAFTGWVPNTTVIQNWFTEKRGLAMGIVSSGIGIGIFVYAPSIQHLINRVGWRMTYRIMAFFIPLIIMSMAIIFLKKPPQTTPFHSAENETLHAVPKDALVIDEEWASRSWTLRQAVLTKQFWLLTVSFFFGSLTNQSILTHHVAFFVDKGLEALFASYIVGMIGIVSIVGKIFWGVLSDRIGREATYTLVTACSICGMLLLIVFAIVSSSSIPYIYAVLFGMGYAGIATLPALIAADFFEGATYGSIFGTLFVFSGVGAALGAWFGGFLHDHLRSYILFFIIMIACAIFACLTIWIAAPRKIRTVLGKRVLQINRHITP